MDKQISNEIKQTIEREYSIIPGNLRIAGILDELSERFFPFECKFVNLDYNHWEKQIAQHNPQLLFVESIWNGFKKTWRGKFSPTNNSELKQLINWCQKHNVPTVFWNKEDPIHMFTFLNTAFLFDYIFTTDLDCVPLYKRLLRHDRVGVLPFANAIQLFNPIEKYERKEAACFAGSYYAKREERKEDFERIADDLIENYQLEIFDRDPYPGNPDYSFPQKYQPFIKGSLPVDKIDIAYKSYKIGITLNIVKHSSTMEARRVFELLGCNTLTVSNPCLGIRNLFGDLVIQNNDNELFQDNFDKMVKDDDYANRLRLLGLRKILTEHTYKERVSYLYEKCLEIKPEDQELIVTVFSFVRTAEDINYIKSSFDNQSYSPKILFLFSQNPNLLDDKNLNVYPIEEFQTILTNQSEFYSYFSTNNYYGQNYLLDLMLSNRYANVSVIGKSSYFEVVEGERKFINEFKPYQLIDQIQLDRSIFQSHLLTLINKEALITGNFSFTYVPCLSIDPYNFCANTRASQLPDVDDLTIDTGITMGELNKVSDSLSPKNHNYSLGFELRGAGLIKNVIPVNKSKFYFYSHPLNYLCFFTLDGKNQKLTINKKIKLADLTFINELSNKTILNVYLNGTLSGKINFYVKYYSAKDKYRGRYLVHLNSCTILPVPEDTEYCQLSIIAQENSQCILKEVLIGPRITNPIDLSEWRG